MDGFDINTFLLKFRYPLLILLIGITLIGGGIIFFNTSNFSNTKVEVLGTETKAGPDLHQGELTVEIAGEVINPGVYKLANSSRIDDLIIAAGGLSASADRAWIEKYLNRASKITDGQKLYIPSINDPALHQDYQSSVRGANNNGGDQTISTQNSLTGGTLVNINTASLSQLDTLPGIGPVYAQSIVEHRPYSTIEELVSKGAIKKSLYEKIKDKISVY